jgi:hypothetical protein
LTWVLQFDEQQKLPSLQALAGHSWASPTNRHVVIDGGMNQTSR